MNKQHAREIIENAVSATKWRWEQYAKSWNDLDRIFIRHGYEQQGFRTEHFVKVLESLDIYSVQRLGSILSKQEAGMSYNKEYAGGLDSVFYAKLRNGENGDHGSLFEQAVRQFRDSQAHNCGRFYWMLLWRMLQSCSYLYHSHSASFAAYVLGKYRCFRMDPNLSEDDFLSMSPKEWVAFCDRQKPWKPLSGIGRNVFDFIFGDIAEARFAAGTYKFDSANEHFLHVTGIASIINPFDRETVIQFLESLELPFTLRQINTGIYTYCSDTESANFGFCRSPDKCDTCAVRGICARQFTR